MSDELCLRTPSLALKFDRAGGWTLLDCVSRQRLMAVPVAAMLVPVLDGAEQGLALQSVEHVGTTARFHFTGDAFDSFVLEVSASPAEDAIDLQCQFRCRRSARLSRIELFPRETIVNLYDVVNFRNRHFTPNTWPELILGGKGCATDTYSGDWQFAPHPSMLLFRRMQTALFAGAFDLPVGTYGMYFEAADYRVKTWHLDYGGAEHGMPLAAGELFVSPRVRLFARTGRSIYEMFDEFTAMLVRDGQISDPSGREQQAWWKEPVYCTWLDQVRKSKMPVPAELQEQAKGGMARAMTMLDEQMVRSAVDVIRRLGLPIRTILIDVGWSVTPGQWEPHPQRFPDMRRLVDDLHATGLKVMVWWNWAELYDDAQANPAHLCGGGQRNRHGRRMRDYSSPVTQREYLGPLFRKLFGSDADCYDFDGVKTDFLADKVHADLAPCDPQWRGEENYIVCVTRLFCEEMRRHKPDAMHMGCAGHFWLSPWMHTNRTYDICSTDWREHEQRTLMLRHTSPGCQVHYDMHGYLENFEGYFDSARRNNAPVQIGNLLYMKDDPFSAPRPADVAYHDLLRRQLLSPRSEMQAHS